MTQGLEILPWKIGMAVSGSEMGKLECTDNLGRENKLGLRYTEFEVMVLKF